MVRSDQKETHEPCPQSRHTTPMASACGKSTDDAGRAALVRPDDAQAACVFQSILEAHQKFGETVLTAAMAQALLLSTSSTVRVVCCWNLASKFEEIDPLDGNELVRMFLTSGEKASLQKKLALSNAKLEVGLRHRTFLLGGEEQAILSHYEFRLPYKNTVRDMYEMFSDPRRNISFNKFTSYCYCLLYAFAFWRDPFKTAEEWLDALHHVDPVLFRMLEDTCPGEMWSRLHNELVSKGPSDAPVDAVEPSRTSRSTAPVSPEGVIDLTLDSPRSSTVSLSLAKKRKVVVDLCTP